jgi:hypothetical protein
VPADVEVDLVVILAEEDEEATFLLNRAMAKVVTKFLLRM